MAPPSGSPVGAVWDVGTRTLTLSGTGTKDQYEAALKAVTFFASEPGGLLDLGEIRTLSIVVRDDSNVSSLTATVTVGGVTI